MSKPDLVRQQVNTLFSEIHYLIRLLYVTEDPHMKNLTLNQLWNKVDQVQFLIRLSDSARPQAASESTGITSPASYSMSTIPALPQSPTSGQGQLGGIPQSPTSGSGQGQSGGVSQAVPTMQPAIPQQSFTREQLAQFDGRNGRAAYVAVNGVVYDVTNNAAWSAATHFGLTAGTELSREFASCHAAEQWILNTITPVGRLVN